MLYPLKRFAELGVEMNNVSQLMLYGQGTSGLLLVKAHFAPWWPEVHRSTSVLISVG